MSTEQRPIPMHPVPEIAPELLYAPDLGDYTRLSPGESFRLYYSWDARFIEREPGKQPLDRGPQGQWLDFQRLSPNQWCEWVVNASDQRFGVTIGGSTVYDMNSMPLDGIVKARQFFTFSRVVPCKLEVVAPDGDKLVVTGAKVEKEFKVGPILGVEWPWGKITVSDVPEN